MTLRELIVHYGEKVPGECSLCLRKHRSLSENLWELDLVGASRPFTVCSMCDLDVDHQWMGDRT